MPKRRFSALNDVKAASMATAESGGLKMLRLPPPIWTLLYLGAGVLASRLMGWPGFPGSRIVPLGIVLFLLGFIPPVWAVVMFRRAGTELNPTSTTNSQLVTGGPYGMTRNPMYLGLVVASLGVAFWTGWTPMFAVPLLVFATANWVHIPFEEAKMRRQFGEAFDAYTHKVRRWI